MRWEFKFDLFLAKFLEYMFQENTMYEYDQILRDLDFAVFNLSSFFGMSCLFFSFFFDLIVSLFNVFFLFFSGAIS